MLKHSTLKGVQGKNQTQNNKETIIHKKKGWTTRHRPQKGKIITITSLDGYLVEVLRVGQLQLMLQSSETHRRDNGGSVFQHIVPYPLIASNDERGQRRPNTMVTPIVGRKPNIPTVTPSRSPRSRRGNDHGDRNEFPIQRSNETPHLLWRLEVPPST